MLKCCDLFMNVILWCGMYDFIEVFDVVVVVVGASFIFFEIFSFCGNYIGDDGIDVIIDIFFNFFYLYMFDVFDCDFIVVVVRRFAESFSFRTFVATFFRNFGID